MEKKLRRSKDRILGGVCAGFAEYLNADITLIRVVYVLLSLVSAAFPGLFFYLICWVIMPLPEGENS